MKDLLDFQHLFNTDLEQLRETPENEVEYLEQNHFGDLLVEKVEEYKQIFKLWRNLDCNDCSIEVEAHTMQTNYRWKIIYNEPLNF